MYASQIDINELRGLKELQYIGEHIVVSTFKKLGLVKDEISQGEAMKLYGKTRIERWAEMGLFQWQRKSDAPNGKKYAVASELALLDRLDKKGNIKITKTK